MSEDTQKDSGQTSKRVRLSSEMSVLAFQQRICPKCNLPVIPGLEKCPRDGASLKQHDSGPHRQVAAHQGQILKMSDRYDHLGSLGSGGMSVVYKARDKVLDRVVAIKQLISVVNSETMVLRFQREACAYAALKHPNIVNVFDFGIDEENRPFLVMDFLEGQTLDELIAARNGLSIPETLEIFIQILDGLSHAHQKGIIHRDLKPANVMIQRFGSNERIQVKIMDFGIAKVKVNDPQSAWQTQTGHVMGSPLYMSPEQSSSSTHVDGRADIYSVGCMLFETMTGRPPFHGESIIETIAMHRSETPPKMTSLIPKKPVIAGVLSIDDFDLDMEAIVYAAIEKRPDDRYQSAADMRADLLCVQENWNKISQGGTRKGVKIKDSRDITKGGGINTNAFNKRILVCGVVVLALVAAGALAFANLNNQPLETRAQSAQHVSDALTDTEPSKQEAPTASKQRVSPVHGDHWTDFGDNEHPLLPDKLLSSIEKPQSVRVLLVGQYSGRARVSKAEEVSTNVYDSQRLDGLERLSNLKTLLIWNLPVTPQHLQTITKLKNLTKVGLVDTTVPHNTVTVFQQALPKLENLELKMSGLTAKDFVDLPKIRLSRLVLDDNNFAGGSGLAPVGKCKELTNLGLNNCGVTDESLKYLTSLPKLTTLMMERAAISTEGCKSLGRVSSLISLNLGFSTTLDDRATKELVNLKELQSLDLQGCEKLTDQCIPNLIQLKQLTRLNLSGTKISEQGLQLIRNELKNIRQLGATSRLEEINQVLVDPSDFGSVQK